MNDPQNADDPTLVPIGTQIGNFQLEALIGEGGFGAVYSALNHATKKRVAIKFLKGAAGHPDLIARFKREAFITNAIGNPHLVETYDIGEHNGMPFIIMEFVEGKSLREVVKVAAGRLPAERVKDIGVQVAYAVSAAHQHKVIHRDLKPDNIFIASHGGSDFVKVLDFGIAKFAGETFDNVKTATQALVGSPQVMSPEQCRSSSEVDERSDVYALGVNLFYMLTGRYPFVGTSPMDVVSGHLRDPIPRFAQLNVAVPPDLEFVVYKAMAKDPNARYQTMSEMRAALAAARTTKSRALWPVAAVIVAILGVVGGVVAWRLWRPTPPPILTPTPTPPQPAPTPPPPQPAPPQPAPPQPAPPQPAPPQPAPPPQQPAPAPPPPKPAPPTPPEPRAEWSTLAVNVDPWAEVFVDGVKKDTTPLRIRVAAGAHKVVLVNPELKRREEIRVQLAPGKTKVIARDFTK